MNIVYMVIYIDENNEYTDTDDVKLFYNNHDAFLYADKLAKSIEPYSTYEQDGEEYKWEWNNSGVYIIKKEIL